MASELFLGTHFLTLEGWTAVLTVGLWTVAPTTGFEPMRVDLIRFEALRVNHSATPPQFIGSLVAELQKDEGNE